MSTAVSAPWARWSASPGVVLALSLFAAPAVAGIAPLPGTQTEWAGRPETQKPLADLETLLSAYSADHSLNSSSRVELQSVEEDDQVEAQAAGFEIFRPGSEVAGQTWPIADVDAGHRPTPSASHPNRPLAENAGTAIPAPPALQSGLCAMGALGLFAMGRRARRALRQ